MSLVELSTGPSFQGGRTSTQRCSRRENSNLVQITSRDTSIWRGKLWSAITLKIKIDKHFISNAIKGAPYLLRPIIVDAKTREVYRPGCDMVRLKFAKNAIFRNAGDATVEFLDTAVAVITSDPHNTIEAEVHRNLFDHGARFNVEVEAVRDNDEEVIFGVSPTILVTNFALAIQQRFRENPHVLQGEDGLYLWYSGCGGVKSGLSVTVHLKDEKGRTVTASNVPMQLKIELVYDDGSPAPVYQSRTVKGHPSTKPLYRPLGSDPVLQPGQGSHSFSFRIEEVSFHHPGHAGFKLKVSLADPAQLPVHPGLQKETVAVLSKPSKHRRDSAKTKRQRSNTASPNVDDEGLALEPRNVRKVSNYSTSAAVNANDVSAHVRPPNGGGDDSSLEETLIGCTKGSGTSQIEGKEGKGINASKPTPNLPPKKRKFVEHEDISPELFGEQPSPTLPSTPSYENVHNGMPSHSNNLTTLAIAGTRLTPPTGLGMVQNQQGGSEISTEPSLLGWIGQAEADTMSSSSPDALNSSSVSQGVGMGSSGSGSGGTMNTLPRGRSSTASSRIVCPRMSSNATGSTDGTIATPIRLEDGTVFWFFVRSLMPYVKQRDEAMHARGQAVINECTKKHKAGDPNYANVEAITRIRLGEVIGYTHWKNVEDRLARFEREMVLEDQPKETANYI